MSNLGTMAAATSESNDEMRLEKNAGLIMGTNNSSIVSKRSVERLYLPEPHFYRYFVRKPQRRSPTINRGYWLRMRAIDHVVRQFLEKTSDQPKVVLNLGCGYDPLAFSWLAREPGLCKNTKFIDVDYEELLVTKCDIVLATPQMSDLLTLRPPITSKGILIVSDQYVAVGCDLRNITRLDRLVKSVVPIQDCLVLNVAEVSITYMSPDASDALIAWSATLSSDVSFCLLEQASPDRPDHPFTAAMVKHFEKLGTPLRTIFEYSGLHTQTQRFMAAGYSMVEVRNLFEMWSDSTFLLPSQRLALDHVEPFDEWEEFALFASHYVVVEAHTNTGSTLVARARRDSTASVSSELSTRTVSPIRQGTQWFAYTYFPNPGDQGCAHHGASFPVTDQDAIGFHGGIGRQSRLKSTSIYASSHARVTDPIIPPPDISARSCHTITTLGNGMKVLVGGRASPDAPMKDCWLQSESGWERIQDLPSPRYRHRCAAVGLPGDNWGVVVFGGKDGPCTVHVDTLLWDPQSGWQILRSLIQEPMPRFGMNFIALGTNHGLMFGGMRQDGIVLTDFWRWRLVIHDDKVAGISFKPSTALNISSGTYPWFARFGSSYSLIRNELLIIGGIAKWGCVPKAYELLSVSGSFSAVAEHEKEMVLKVSSFEPIAIPHDHPRPLLVGHSSVRTKRDQTLIVGGGATCFSFGTHWNRGTWLLHDRDVGLRADWSLLNLDRMHTPPPRLVSRALTDLKISTGNENDQSAAVARSKVSNEDEFINVVQQSLPLVFTDLNVGPCIQLWTVDYLRHKIAPTREVVVHKASSRNMNFQKKDFAYTTLKFSDFLTGIENKEHLYLRSTSTICPLQTPSTLSDDFPELSPDFILPPQYSFVTSHFHSSPLRISANVNMWLHYDVMANILFQIRGTKRLILYPPSDIAKLSYRPGCTTSTLTIFPHHGDPHQTAEIANTTPQTTLLHPNEALFIPPLWSHTASPVDSDDHKDDVNMSVNVFFKSFNENLYATGRDVYGNRDLAAYEKGRRDVDRLVRRFDAAKGIPREVARAYLQRLVMEMEGKIEEL